MVEEVNTYEELINAIFKSDDGELGVPKPHTFILFTQDDTEEKKTINDILCVKGEEAVKNYMEYIPSTREIKLILYKLDIVNAEAFLYHPHIRLREYPTLMSVDGSRRLEGGDVADENLLNLFFEEEDSQGGANPCFRIWWYSPLSRTIDVCKNYWKYAADEEYTQANFDYPEGLPGRSYGEVIGVPETCVPSEDLSFWNVKKAVLKKIEAQAEVTDLVKGLDLKSEEATKVIEEKIRSTFKPKVPEPTVSFRESTQEHPNEDSIRLDSAGAPIGRESLPDRAEKALREQTDEPIVPFNLDDLCLKKETVEIERKPKILPPAPKKSKNKNKKGKKGKGKGKDIKGKKDKGKGKDKKGKGKKKGK